MERIQNFHSLFGIMAGLKVATVARLRLEEDLPKLWRETNQRLSDLASTFSNWKLYRDTKERATRFPFFPFIGVYLQDLQVAEAREKTMIDDVTVNFAKMRRIGVLLREIVYIQSGTEYRFNPHPRILSYLLSMQLVGDEDLMRLSHSIRSAGPDGESHERANNKTFLASAISPRQRPSSSVEEPPVPAPLALSQQQSRPRASSISTAFHKWQKVRSESAAEGESGASTPPSPRSERSKSGSSPSPPSSAQAVISPRSERSKSGASTSSSQSQKSPRSMGPSPHPPSPLPSPREEQQLCPVCASTFNSRKALSDHISKRQCTGSSMKQHTCPVCERVFSRKDELVAHLQARTCVARGASMSCPLCGEVFASADLVRAHIHNRGCL